MEDKEPSESAARKASATEVRLDGVCVQFPRPPYPCQVEFMKKTIQALNAGTNALLESPTGTGKTLSLLCSTLAWQRKRIGEMKERKRVLEASQPVLHGAVSVESNSHPPLIVYSSRTHSQLTQVVKELRATAYKPKMAVLGSRDQLCIHDQLSRFKGHAKNMACANKVKDHSCSYKNNLDMKTNSKDNGNLPLTTDALDIEDLAKLGREGRFCPYYYSRQVSTEAELVLLPYNYLLDPSMRARTGINWQNAVVIFDEAHNIERVASDAASCTLSSTDIATCIDELKSVLRLVSSYGASSTKSDGEGANKLPDVAGEMTGQNASNPSVESTMALLRNVFAMEGHLDAVHLSMCGVGNTPACVMPGNWFKSMLESSGFAESRISSQVAEINGCVNFLCNDAQYFNTAGSESASTMHVAEPKLANLAKCIDRVFRTSNESSASKMGTVRLAPTDSSDYKVYICEKDREVVTNNGNHSQKKTVKMRVIHYWAFSPGISLEDLKRLGVKSVIMTSGTLSPMDSFTDDMKIQFPVQLQNDHVIRGDKQVWVGAMAKGASGKQLNSSYTNRDTNEYKDELGLSILNICQTMIGDNRVGGLPPAPELTGGILVFFPSYGMMDSAVARWKETGMLNRFSVVGGPIVIEPKGSGSSHASGSRSKSDNGSSSSNSHSYNPRSSEVKKSSFLEPTGQRSAPQADSSDPEGEELLRGVVGEFEKGLKQSRRCILLAVCRGKVSEGIDFSDDRGRIVIITGLPYSPHMDPWVVLKRQYLDEKSKQFAMISTMSAPAGGSHSKSSHKMTGQEWYQQSAVRAVNQAIGRVIRHKNDWGAIFLLDDRFLADKQKTQLSKWVRPRHKPFSVFAEGMVDFRKFITEAMEDPSLATVSRFAVPRSRAPLSRPLQSRPVESNAPKVYSREAYISESDIPTQQDGSNYINPMLLSSQQGSADTFVDMYSEEHSHDVDKYFERISTQPSASQSEAPAAALQPQPPKVFSIFDRKSRPLTTTMSMTNAPPAPPATSSSTLSTITSWSAADAPRTQGEAVLHKKISLSYESSSASKDKESRFLSASQGATSKFTLGSQEDFLGFQTASAPAAASLSTRASSSSSTSSTRSKERLEKQPGSKMSSIMANIQSRASKMSTEADLDEEDMDWLSQSLSLANFKSAKSLLVAMKNEAWDGMKAIQDNLSKIIALFSDAKREWDVSRIVSIFGKQSPTFHRATFTKLLEQNLVAMKAKNKAVAAENAAQRVILGKEKSTKSSNDSSQPMHDEVVSSVIPSIRHASVSSAAPSTSSSSSNSSSSNSKQASGAMSSTQGSSVSSSQSTSAYIPSKRAMAMFAASKESAPDNTLSQSILSRVTKKPRVEEATGTAATSASSKRGRPSNIFESMTSADLSFRDTSTSASSAPLTSSKLSCIICRETSQNPCVGTCGHVCCETCWKQWLATKSSCPLCRTPLTAATISKIVIK